MDKLIDNLIGLKPLSIFIKYNLNSKYNLVNFEY